MIVSTAIYRRDKRDGRNPSTGARALTLEERKKLAAEKKKKLQSESPAN